MQIRLSRAFAALLLLVPAVGCQSTQPDIPEELLPQEPPASFDYIDDRAVSRVVDLDEEYEPLRQIALLAGVREFTDDRIWGDVDGEVAFGIEYFHEIDNGIGWEVGGMGSLGTKGAVGGNVDVTGAAAEIYAGARYIYRRDRLHPYVGGGLSAIFAGVDDDNVGQVADDQDLTMGVYLHGGFQYDLTSFLFIGLDLRTLFGTDLELTTISGDADYWQLGLVLGFDI